MRSNMPPLDSEKEGHHDPWFRRPSYISSYRLGTEPSTWPSVVVRSGLGSVNVYSELLPSPTTPSPSVGVSPSFETIKDRLARTVTEYNAFAVKNWSPSFLILPEGATVYLPKYKLLRKELDNRIAAAGARKILEESNEQAIPWEQAQADLGF
jgi:hypothetical protein